MNSWVLNHLEKMQAFETIVRNGSLVRASRELNVSQPALSRVVSSLESVSGKKLLFRSRLGCLPTPEGKEIVRFYEKLLPLAKDLEQKVISREKLAGVLAVGTFESFATTWWPGFLKRFSKDFSGLRLSIRTADHGLHREKLLRGGLDVVVEACPDEHEKITSIKIGSDSFGLYEPKHGKSERPLPLVYVPHAKDNQGNSVGELLRSHGIHGREAYELDSFSAVHEFIAAGVGIGVLPERLARNARERNQIRRSDAMKETFGMHSICMSFLNENRNDPRVVALSRALRTYLS